MHREVHRLSEYGSSAADIAVHMSMRLDAVQAILARPLQIGQGPRWTGAEREERARKVRVAARNGVPIADIASALGASETWVRSVLLEEAAKVKRRATRTAPDGR
ncbi:hypothetical protein SAMN06264364_1871 [Quadrisphaera granulorum]|uniref:Homeodomain-like domain-containing protein n=1 Tax=Quadrisphaera granulorum TaxID=317664 RepID=A0A315ZTU7_9ACTN|nr:hypothetical protein [Quadrisphaera granulorum]PWJ39099.1 hypothetical protein BXY45_1871 [Quadrisphaera granulorum]SZE99247.1 hypothetical protein SAMN06264364_1871 [Quadrisphaera granulorum]